MDARHARAWDSIVCIAPDSPADGVTGALSSYHLVHLPWVSTCYAMQEPSAGAALCSRGSLLLRTWARQQITCSARGELHAHTKHCWVTHYAGAL